MIDDPKFAAFMEAVLQPCEEVRLDSVNSTDSGKIAAAILAANFHSLGLRILQMDIARRFAGDRTVIVRASLDGLRPARMFIDEIYEFPPAHDPLKAILGLHTDASLLEALDRLKFSPLAQDEPEPRAKNGALASKKTQAAKAKLPFYHKNRRF
jgi:hypothetical protein